LPDKRPGCAGRSTYADRLIGALDEGAAKSLLALITQNHLHAQWQAVLDLGD
jgi:hypothetical protein